SESASPGALYAIIEASLLSIQNISMRFGAKILFEDVTCTFLAGRRYAITGHGPLWRALEERDALYGKPHDQLTDEDGMRLGELEGTVGEEGGYTAESDAATLLDGLGVDQSLHERRMGELQGGQKMRVLLAQALFGTPPLLLLDEPTNHLDLDSVHWLQ